MSGESLPKTRLEQKDSAEVVPKVVEAPANKPVSLEAKQQKVFGADVEGGLKELEERQEKSWADTVLGWVGIERDKEGPKPKSKDAPEAEGKGFWATVTGGVTGTWAWLSGKTSTTYATIKEKGLFGWVSGLFGWGKKKVEKAKDVVVAAAEDAFSYPPDMVAKAVNSLETAMTKHTDWKGFVEAASKRFGVKPEIGLAMINFESRFNPTAVNPSKYSDASGLGQFISRTWNGMQKYLPDHLKGRNVFDPEANIFATFAYCAENAKACGIDLNAPDAARQLYLAHHEGAEGFKRLMAFVRDGVKFKIKKPYFLPKDKSHPEKGKYFEAFDVWIKDEDDCENYAKLLFRMAGRIQLVANEYVKHL